MIDSAIGHAGHSVTLAIVTEWKKSPTPDFEAVRAALRTPVVFDGRSLYEPSVMAAYGLE